MAEKLVLVVDDEEGMRHILALTLALELNVRVESAIDGEDALRQIQARKPDLVVLDMMMPKVDGFAVCRALKADPATRHIPIVGVTAIHDGELLQMALAAGCNDLLGKPFNLDDFSDRVKEWLATTL